MQNKAIFYFHFDIFIFENKVAAMECPVFLSIVMFKLSVQDNHKSFYNYLLLMPFSWMYQYIE